MTCKIESDAFGKDVIWTEVNGRKTALPAEHIYVRASDGACFTAPINLRGLSRLSPADVEMIEHYRHEKGMCEPVVFAGDTMPEPVVAPARRDRVIA